MHVSGDKLILLANHDCMINLCSLHENCARFHLTIRLSYCGNSVETDNILLFVEPFFLAV